MRFTQGNLMDAPVQALVNTVNTVGVMGKGIAMMFKEAYPDNYRQYVLACKRGDVQTGRMFVTQTGRLTGPKWIINFPTKAHWRSPSRMEWIVEGLQDLRAFLLDHNVQSVALPPLGAGNGGLNWAKVRPHIEAALAELPGIDIVVYEPTDQYQNVAKRKGVEKLTPSRALVAELVRRYSIMGMECSLLEIQKLTWFLQRFIQRDNALDWPAFKFEANKFGPYAPILQKTLDGLDGSYLHCNKRIADASPFEPMYFEEKRKDLLDAYLNTDAKAYVPALDQTTRLIEGFESPFGMELLASVDWLLVEKKLPPEVVAIRHAMVHWPSEKGADRKARIFDERVIGIALERLTDPSFASASG